jgi:hypothetical protein
MPLPLFSLFFRYFIFSIKKSSYQKIKQARPFIRQEQPHLSFINGRFTTRIDLCRSQLNIKNICEKISKPLAVRLKSIGYLKPSIYSCRSLEFRYRDLPKKMQQPVANAQCITNLIFGCRFLPERQFIRGDRGLFVMQGICKPWARISIRSWAYQLGQIRSGV